MCINFFPAGEETNPVPRGAGIKRTRTEPHLPVTLHFAFPVAFACRVSGPALALGFGIWGFPPGTTPRGSKVISVKIFLLADFAAN